MPSTSAAFSRDANRVPITNYGFRVQNSQTLAGSNTTVNTALFQVTGTINVRALFGEVTTVLGANNTQAYYQIDDQTATPDITLASGTTLSAAAVGSIIARTSVAGVAVVLANASAGRVTDPVAATAPDVFMPFLVTQKTASVLTTINFVYSTTDTPTSGVIRHNVDWLPVSDDGNLVAL